MASLTHVCMWSDKGWKRITASEAARLHPGGTVSANSGLFMCELCGQYVLLTDGFVQARHFRHSSSEKSKDCPERTFGSGVSYSYGAGDHELPIRIKNIASSSFELEMGFIQVPQNLLSSDLRIEIKINSSNAQNFVYLKERLNIEGITYLAIGGVPRERYLISITGATDSIKKFWPEVIQGIDPSGTLFDATDGKKLVYDSDVAVGKKYYLLRRGALYSYWNSHMSIREICTKRVSWEVWKVYEVVANDYDEQSARFFLDYHCRLTDSPIDIQTVWPVFIENPYVVKCNQENVIIYISGNAPTTNVFPSAYWKEYCCGENKIIEIFCNSRQQLISAGRTKALKYTYFWMESLDQKTDRPSAAVTDIKNRRVAPGRYDTLPDNKTLCISVPFDGCLIVKIAGEVMEKRKIRASIPIEVDNVAWNMELKIYVGLDCIWSASYIHEEKAQVSNEKEILRRLQTYAGKQIPVSHTLGSLAHSLLNYPDIRRWLYKCIKTGYMNERAYRELQFWVTRSKENNTKKGGSV